MKMKPVKIVFCGDTFLKTKENANDPFHLIRDEFRNINIIFLNLETVICESNEKITKQIKHVSLIEHPDKLDYVRSLGDKGTIRIVNLAQNHILDFGLQGLDATIRHLQNNNIEYVGLKSNPSTLQTINGRKILFTSGYNRYKIFEKNSEIIADESDVKKEISKFREKVDYVVVSMHWGTEHVLYANPIQQKLAREFIDIGADLIIGHHPHCIQGYETYRGKKIYYSLGNFNFWGLGKKNLMKNRKNVIVETTITETPHSTHIEKPIFINDNYQPFIDNSQGIIRKLEEISKYNQPKINSLLFYRIAAKTYLKGNLISRLFIIKKKPSKVLNTLIWILAKPFNWYCYLGILINFIAGDKSALNDWE